MSTSAAVLDQRLSQLIGDFLEVVLTTALTTSTSVISTNLNIYDDGNDDHFNDWWVYITDYANLAKDRKIYDYTTTDGTCTVRGAVFTDESDLATIRISRHSYTKHIEAINDALRELSGVLFREIDDRTLVTGNILWDGHLEDWVDTDELTFWTSATGTLLKTTTAGAYRGALGTTSLHYTAGATPDKVYQTNAINPRLMDLQGKTVSAYVWVYPEVANSATITIYTESNDGTTTQTLASETKCAAAEWTLLKLEDQAINDDLSVVQIWLSVATNTKDVIFDNVRITGKVVHEYMLPDSLQDGNISQVYVQRGSYSSYPCDDIMPTTWDRVFQSEPFVTSDGTNKFLNLQYSYGSNRQIRLIGTAPLSTLSSFSGTTEIEGNQVDLLTAYAAYCLFRNEEGVPSSEDTGRYRSRAQKWLMEYYRLLPSLRMLPPHGTLHLPTM